MSDVVKDALRKYMIQLQAHPLRTKAITAGVMAGCSDVAAQKITGIKKIQIRRLLLIMLYGFAYGGPFGHFLHKLMDFIFKGKKDTKTVAKKVILEQLTSSPWNNLMFMLYYGLIVEGRSLGLVRNKIRSDYPKVQLAAWKFWPIVGWVNYQYMPKRIPRSVPQLCRFMLGNLSEPESKIYCWQECLDFGSKAFLSSCVHLSVISIALGIQSSNCVHTCKNSLSINY